MKRVTSLMLFVLCVATFESKAQVEIDKSISLTGSGTDARVTGIKSITSPQDGVSAEAIQKSSLLYALASGSTNAYAVTLTPAITGSVVGGTTVHFVANAANTGAATLNINGVDDITIKKNYDADLEANDIKAGQAVTVIYDGTNFQMLSQLGNAGASASFGCRVYQTVALTDFRGKVLSFQAEQFDDDNMHDISTNIGRITINTAGHWLVGACLLGGSSANGLTFRLNGTTNIGGGGGSETTGGGGGDASTLRYFDVGDYIEVIGACSTGSQSTSGDEGTNFWAVKLF